jgi:putative tricarboxylic transport membrane protein
MPAFSRPKLDDLAVGLAVLGFALVVAYEVTEIPTPAVYAKVGPRAIPWLVAGLLGVLGALLTWQAFTGGWAHEEEHGEFDYRSLGWLGLGLALNIGLIETAGFIIASTLMFITTARAFGSVTPLRDGAIGFALAFVSYVGFDRVLGYKIGTGLIEQLF